MMDIRSLRRRIFILCWCAYAGAYLCRTNLSIVIPVFIEDLGWDKGTIGLMGSFFFWSYAFGQLINGYLGDRVNPRIFIFLSLFFSSIINIILGSVLNKLTFTLLWGINGFLLSMLWGPIIRTLGLWFPKESNNKIGIGISTSMFMGYILYWGPVGRFIKSTNWRLAFYLPGILVFLFSIYWFIAMRSNTKMADIKTETKSVKQPIKELLNPGLLLIAIACMIQGMLKESIGLWTPTILKDTIGDSIPIATNFSWKVVILLWGILSIIGVISIYSSQRRKLA